MSRLVWDGWSIEKKKKTRAGGNEWNRMWWISLLGLSAMMFATTDI